MRKQSKTAFLWGNKNNDFVDNIITFFHCLQCSTTCGDGIQTRKVTCVLMDREADSELQCDMDVRPDTERPCNLGDCKPEDYDIAVIIKNTVVGISHWRTGPWSAVSL